MTRALDAAHEMTEAPRRLVEAMRADLGLGGSGQSAGETEPRLPG